MNLGKTIGVDLWAGQVRGGANHATVYGSVPRPAIRHSMRELFLAAYPKLAGLCREVDEPGLALLAIDESTGAPAGVVRLRARFGRHVASIVGRHDQCDLYLDRHTSLALRHLAVVLDPVQSWRRNSATVRYRVFDLRTERGFTDEESKRMRGLRAEGPAFVRCAGHALFILPLGDPTDWPESAEDAWAMLPERVYFDELQCNPEGTGSAVRLERKRESRIFRTHGPRDTGMGLVEGGIAGTLEVDSDGKQGRLAIGESALRDGVLLGRYARCDGAALLADGSLSRVHMLLLHVDNALLAIDTASRNGSHLPGHSNARVIAIDGDAEIHLGKHTRIRWRWTA